MGLKDYISKLFNNLVLTKAESYDALNIIAEGNCNNSQIAAFLSVYNLRDITVDELQGFREALLELCIPVDLTEFNPIDLCGTGGDGKNTFNISTLASFVTAGAGIPVAKHGNYGVSSGCGSSNVLENLGVKFSNDSDFIKRCISEAGICFLHAPLFHPAMKNVGPVRQELGMKTFFNMLGPMVNPCKPKRQMVGVFNLALARLYSYLFQESTNDYVIVHSLDGYDEVSLTGEFKIITNHLERVLSPEDFGCAQIRPEEIEGGDNVKDGSEIFMKILNGKGSQTQNQVVLANAALAIYCAFPELSFEDAFQLGKESLMSEKAKQAFDKLTAISSL